MKTYEFSLSFTLADADTDPAQLVDTLYEAGCDDATAGVGKPGRLALEFNRKGASAEAAVRSAIRDVLKAAPGAHLVEAKPDMVNLSDLAEIVGCSRQNMRKYAAGEMTGTKMPFPSPVFTGAPSLWCLCEVGTWLIENTELQPSVTILQTAAAACDVNREASSRRVQASREKLFGVA